MVFLTHKMLIKTINKTNIIENVLPSETKIIKIPIMFNPNPEFVCLVLPQDKTSVRVINQIQHI